MPMGFDATLKLIDDGEDFTALSAGGDGVALGALRALRRRGLKVPDDVSLVGFNDEELARIAEPPLTTVKGPNEEAGMRCVELLRQVIDNTREEDGPVVLPVEIVVRESTGPLRAE
jgi:LacI family transcriptional regulator, repressor for deo operon, udp, cdd, tsx, nupC, and nupG